MRKRPGPPEINIGGTNLPAELAEQVRLLLRDPVTGRTRYGMKKRLDIMFWSNWVDAQLDHNAAARHAPLLERL